MRAGVGIIYAEITEILGDLGIDDPYAGTH